MEKQNVCAITVARLDCNADLIWKHPDDSIPRSAQSVVRADEWAVFARGGRPVGMIAPVRCTLSSSVIPFLSGFEVPEAPEVFRDMEVYFVRQGEVEVALDGVELSTDWCPEEVAAFCASGTARVVVENPERLVSRRFGDAHEGDSPSLLAWLTDMILGDLSDAIQRLCETSKRSVIEVALDPATLTTLTCERCAGAGLSLSLRDVAVVFDEGATQAKALRAVALAVEKDIARQTAQYDAIAQEYMARARDAPAVPEVRCEGCKARVNAARFCAECGAAISHCAVLRFCRDCLMEFRPDEKVCSGCGAAA